MRCFGIVLLLVSLMTSRVVHAQSNLLMVVLQKAVVSESKDRAEWSVVLSNSTPTDIRFSHFSLASAIRAAKFVDDAGNEWQVIRPKEVIDPPSPDVDFRLRIPAKSVVSLTIRTRGIELLQQDGGGATTNRNPGTLAYKLERRIEVVDDNSKRSSWWKGSGSGTVKVEWKSRQ